MNEDNELVHTMATNIIDHTMALVTTPMTHDEVGKICKLWILGLVRAPFSMINSW
jgi:hypothetical protein